MPYFDKKNLAIAIASVLAKSQWVGANEDSRARYLKKTKGPKSTKAPKATDCHCLIKEQCPGDPYYNPDRVKKSKRRLEPKEDMGKCASELYDLSLNVNEYSRHMSLIATPKCEGSKCEDCPSILYEATPVTYLEKMSFKVEVNGDVDGLAVGSFPLSSLQDAFDNASIDTTSPYDIVSNNCASLPMKMGELLDLDPTDPKVATYVAEKLGYKADGLIASLYDTSAGTQIIVDADGDQAAVVDDFVSAVIQAHR